MKILLLSGGSSIHTVRWVNALAGVGVKVVLATQHLALEKIAPEVKLIELPYKGPLGYFLNVSALREILVAEQPDLLHAHYASGYGTTARLSGFKPLLLSVWGSDVYDFPAKSPLHRFWLRRNLLAATCVASTSHAMAAQTRDIAPELKEIPITPFGVETDCFSPPEGKQGTDDQIVLGTVKVLKSKYGIDTLIDSFAILVTNLRQTSPAIAERLRFRIVGDGPDRAELEKQASRLGLDSILTFTGRVSHNQVPEELRKLDVFAALSRLDSESFGVAVIEAGACGLPVVVSNVGGLPEVVVDGKTGIVVPKEDPHAAAAALRTLVLDADLRRKMGEAGRQRVVSHYDWNENVRQMIELYSELIAGHQGRH